MVRGRAVSIELRQAIADGLSKTFVADRPVFFLCPIEQFVDCRYARKEIPLDLTLPHVTFAPMELKFLLERNSVVEGPTNC